MSPGGDDGKASRDRHSQDAERGPAGPRSGEDSVGGSEASDDPLDVSARIDGERPGIDTEDDDGENPGPIRWLLGGEGAGATFLREFLGSVLVVLVVGILLFAISGVWPPMVAVKSGSMEPHMERGDLVFVMEEHRFAPEASVEGTGIVTHERGMEVGYSRFGGAGDVIIYRKNGNPNETPIIHRARFWVSSGENWYDQANKSFVDGKNCAKIDNCPAPHAGFITKGDNNGRYDQVSGISGPVKPEWIKGTAEFRIPWLGHVRLELSGLVVGT